jgi:hypothetical protein
MQRWGNFQSGGGTSNLVVELSIFECALPIAPNPLSQEWPTYDELSKLPARDVELLSRVSANTRSGHRVAMRQVRRGVSKVKPTVEDRVDADGWDFFLDGESGLIASVEPVVGPDGISIDAGIDLRFRLPEGTDASSETTIDTNFSGWENYPATIFVSQSPRDKSRHLVVIGNVKLTNPGGWTLKKLDAAEKDEPKGE